MTKRDSEESTQGHTYVQWAVALLANTTFLTYGLQAGWISPTTILLQSESSPSGRPLTDNEITLIASATSLFAMFGVYIFALAADKFGRKAAILTIFVFQTLVWVIKLFSASVASLIIARALCGIPTGGCFNVVPIYVKEISQDNLRGVLGSLFVLVQNVAMLIMYAMGTYMDYYAVLWTVLGVPLVTILLMLKAPESPAFLVKKGKVDEAASVLALLRGLDKNHVIIKQEIKAIESEDEFYRSLPSVSFVGIFKEKPWRRIFIVILMIFTTHGFNGSFAIMSFAASILMASGVTVSPNLLALSFPGFMIVGSILCIFTIEKIGRKWILSAAYIISIISFGILATTLLIQYNGGFVPVWVPVIALILIAVAYAGGISPVPYVVMSEVFNFQIRAKVIGCIVSYAWFTSFAQVVALGPVSSALGPHVIFYVFAVINVIGLILCLTIMPETRGKTVEEIEIMFGKKI